MSDWRDMEKKLVEALRQLGTAPKMCADYPYSKRTNGDWYVVINKEINVTDLARLCAVQD